ncbi:hypothetical protein ABPG72_006745 [Tetrahymena utriculariae]
MRSSNKKQSNTIALNTSNDQQENLASPLRRATPQIQKKDTSSKLQNISLIDSSVSTNPSLSTDSKVKVFIRSRPILPNENTQESSIQISKQDNLLMLNEGNYSIQTSFDKAFVSEDTQVEVFQEFQNPIAQVLEGYNFTIFAYGQTGSGKTYTMFGSDWEKMTSKPDRVQKQHTFFEQLDTDDNFAGIIPRTIYYLFNSVEQKKKENSNLNIQIYCSFLQIYNEKIFDLLQDNNLNKPLGIHESKLDGIFVEGLSEYQVLHYIDTLQLMKRGERNRTIRSTSMNAKSSRSHTIFELIIETFDESQQDGGNIKRSRINLCDLAGSEKINKSEVMAGGHLNELRNINLSLTTLGKVIHSLSSKSKLPIPFRESKLTRILQESLIGNTITYIVATISPSIDNIDETVSTLKFAERARHITMSIKPNQINSKDDEIVKKLQKEILYLKEVLNMRRKGASLNDIHAKFLKLQAENEKLKKDHVSLKQVEQLIEENRHLKTEIQQLYMRESMQKDNTHFSNSHKIQSFEDIDSPVKSLPSISNSASNYYHISTSNDSGSTKNISQLLLKNKSERYSANNIKSQFSVGTSLPYSHSSNDRSVNLGKYNANIKNYSFVNNNAIDHLSNSVLRPNSFFGMNPVSHTPVNIRIKGRQQYKIQNGFIEMNQQDLLQQQKSEKEKKRILERLDQLERIQKFNQAKLQKELNILDSLEKKPANSQKIFSLGSQENVDHYPNKMSSCQQFLLGSLQQRQYKSLKNYEFKIKDLERRYFSVNQNNKK